MRCSFCYSRSVRRDHELHTDTWKRFVDDNAGHISAINYGTGENPLVAEWLDLVLYVRKHYPAIRQALTTNGTAIRTLKSPKTRKLLLKSLDEIDISLDYVDPDRHNASRGCASAYRMAIQCLDEFPKMGVSTTLVMIGLQETLALSNLKGLFAIAADAGAFLRMNLYRPMRPHGMRTPSLARVLRALEWILANHAITAVSDPLFAAYLQIDPSAGEPRGSFSLRALPDGSITPSTYLISSEWRAANIRDNVLLHDLPGLEAFRRLREAPIPASCRQCQSRDLCRGGACDRRYLHYGTLAARDPYCPRRYGLPVRRRAGKPRICKSGPSVHVRYLPTMVFKPLGES
jgi:radical SAM protein with 4Fe4S-binding SPASM domain